MLHRMEAEMIRPGDFVMVFNELCLVTRHMLEGDRIYFLKNDGREYSVTWSHITLSLVPDEMAFLGVRSGSTFYREHQTGDVWCLLGAVCDKTGQWWVMIERNSRKRRIGIECFPDLYHFTVGK
jgi:hypothetical protein